jgi:hypothetical protein
VRTVIAPLPRAMEAQLEALDARLASIARRFIRRLALEPQLGHPVNRGLLGSVDARAVYFDRRPRAHRAWRGRRLPGGRATATPSLQEEVTMTGLILRGASTIA